MSTPKPLWQTAKLNPDMCAGAAVFVSFISDLFTMSGKASFTPAQIVNSLDMIAQRELPEGLFDLVKDLAERNRHETQ